MKKENKKTVDEWYKYLWKINNAFRSMPASEKNKNKKITKEEYYKEYTI